MGDWMWEGLYAQNNADSCRDSLAAESCLGGCGFQPQGFTGWKPVPLSGQRPYDLCHNQPAVA